MALGFIAEGHMQTSQTGVGGLDYRAINAIGGTRIFDMWDIAFL